MKLFAHIDEHTTAKMVLSNKFLIVSVNLTNTSLCTSRLVDGTTFSKYKSSFINKEILFNLMKRNTRKNKYIGSNSNISLRLRCY